MKYMRNPMLLLVKEVVKGYMNNKRKRTTNVKCQKEHGLIRYYKNNDLTLFS